MSDTNTNASRIPTHIAYQVINRGEGKKSKWVEVGIAWRHRQGDGFNLQLRTIPVDGRVTVRVASDKKS